MSFTSKTGLTASPTKKIYRDEESRVVQLRAIARPAPFVLKPFAGLYNPYPYGCSLLCNHPTDTEAKEILRKAKETWASEGKNVLLPEEIEAIRAGLEQCQSGESKPNKCPAIESIPEELFRRYTETDSRPLTPAPTVASAATRASGSRRCVTPDPSANQIREKTLLILDLRRSHSQETISWLGTSSLEPPVIRIQKAPTRSATPENTSPKSKSPHLLSNRSPTPVIKSPKPPEKELQDADEDEFIKRRGKKRRKKRDSSRGPPAFQNSIDPETQVATIGPESRSTSARPSLIPAVSEDIPPEKRNTGKMKNLEINSFLNMEVIKQLRRELNEEVIDNEFNLKRRKALEEALKTVPKNKPQCEELTALQKELNMPQVDAEFWLSLPRIFTRSTARFELPLDSRLFKEMTPLDYIRDYIYISSPRKLLYNCIFNKFKINEESGRRIEGREIQMAMNLMMGRPMTEEQQKYIRDLIGWTDCDVMDFKTFCGLCALTERLLAPEYCHQLPDRKTDPCHEIESADFQGLTRKLYGQNADSRLIEILHSIKTK